MQRTMLLPGVLVLLLVWVFAPEPVRGETCARTQAALALALAMSQPELKQPCRCLEGETCHCTVCECEWQRYLKLRERAIRDSCWLVVAVGMEPPAGYLACRMRSFAGDSRPRLIFAYGSGNELWRHREVYLAARREVIPGTSSLRVAFFPASC